MKKLLIGIFAHPDDEAFGPAGTLLREVRDGAELHLITLTAGENGTNLDQLENLRVVRLAEWHKAGALIGAAGMHHLGFVDGTLGNLAMLDAVENIEQLIRELTAQQMPPEIEIMSMDINGISGHIDHIVASRAAHQVFYRLKRSGLPLTRLRLACVPRADTGDTPNLDFVFMEPGRLPEEIDEVIDNRDHLDEIYQIMHAHHTQRKDCAAHLQKKGENVAINYFIVKN